MCYWPADSVSAPKGMFLLGWLSDTASTTEVSTCLQGLFLAITRLLEFGEERREELCHADTNWAAFRRNFVCHRSSLVGSRIHQVEWALLWNFGLVGHEMRGAQQDHPEREVSLEKAHSLAV